jgi:murein hydrolase activator
MNRKIIFSLSIIFFSLFISSQEKKQKLTEERDKVLKEIELTNKLIEETVKNRGNSLNEVELIGEKITKRKSLLEIYQTELAQIEENISVRDETISKLEKELVKQKRLYAEFIQYSYKNFDNYNVSLYLFASTDLNQFYMRKKYLDQLDEARKEKIILIIKIRKRIQIELDELEQQKKVKQRLINGIITENSILVTEKKNHEKKIKDLEKKEKDLKSDLAEKRKIEEELSKKIEELIKSEVKKNSFASLTPEEKLISTDFEKNKGRLPWPTIQGIITEHFGEHDHQVIKNVVVRNNGIDITTMDNENVRCVFNGQVSKIFAIKGANYTVIVRHGEYYTVYHNLSNVSVNVGDNLKTKDFIGKASKSKTGENSLIHFEIWKGLEKLNPEDWISR